MLDRSNALKAKHVLSQWLETKGDRMTAEEEETLELILTSPVGTRACTRLGTTLHHVRDLMRLGYGPVPSHIPRSDISYHVDRLRELRAAAGRQTSVAFMMSASAILSGPAGERIASDIARLDAVLTILWELPEATKAAAAK